jgi:DNA-binding beta-propeller fold protein YncE
MSNVKRVRYVVVAGVLAAVGASGLLLRVRAQRVVPAPAVPAAVEVLTKDQVLQRLAERSPNLAPPGTTAPSFVVDPAWPKILPHNWIIGDVGGLYVDSHDNVWVYHRPRMTSATDAGAMPPVGKNEKGLLVTALGFTRPYNEPNSGCCIPAPSVLEFNKAGDLIRAWGGPGDPGFLDKRCRQADGCWWPSREHGIFVDHNDFVYVAGNGQAVNFHGQNAWAPNFGEDSQVLKFKNDGTFVYQIGKAGAKGPNSNDTNGGINGTPQPFWPADMTVDPKTNTMYIADGYGNRRVLIVDATTGKYKGHFGAYGVNPVVGENGGGAGAGEDIGNWTSDYHKGNLKPKFYRSPLHCAKLANDGLLYVCDRGNNRIQVFKAAEVGKPCANPNGDVGKCGFVADVPIAPQSAGGTSGTVNFSTDPGQTCMYVADLANDTVYVINRTNLSEISRFGTGGGQVGQFHWPHMVSVDSEGSVYVGEVDNSRRIQKFQRYGATSCSGQGNPKIGAYRATN